MTPNSCLPFLLSALLATASAGGVAAQTPDDPWPDQPWNPPRWVGDVTFLSANALLGGLTAGVFQELRGGSFRDGFVYGALGGGVSYGGRRLAGEDFWGAGLLGRQVSAVGASVVRNAAEGHPLLSRVALRAGPVIVEVNRGATTNVRPRIDANSSGWLIAAVLDDRLRVDWSGSLSAGAPVFDAPDHLPENHDGPVLGQATGGLVLLGKNVRDIPGVNVFAHERVHVLQYDFASELWGVPLENWIAARIPGGSTVVRFAQPMIAFSALQEGVTRLFDIEWKDRPWEIEADYIEHRE